MSQQFFYKTTDADGLAACAKVAAEQEQFHAKRKALKLIFGGEGSPMRRGTTSYIGGVKIGYDADLDVHWKRPDDHGYRALRSSPKFAKGTPKEEKAILRFEHDRLLDLWKVHASVTVEQNQPLEALGVDWSHTFLSGGGYFFYNNVLYLTLGTKFPGTADVTEILASEYSDALEALKTK